MGTATSLKIDQSASYDRVRLNAFVGFIVGFAGGLVGLGGAELRLPYLTGTLRLPLKTAIPVNLAVSLTTLVAALPTRLYTLRIGSVAPFLSQTGALAIGAMFGAYFGVNWLRHLSSRALHRAVFALLMGLGIVMIAEAFITVTPLVLLPRGGTLEIISGLVLGFGIGTISGLLGVAGGEVIIPALVLGFWRSHQSCRFAESDGQHPHGFDWLREALAGWCYQQPKNQLPSCSAHVCRRNCGWSRRRIVSHSCAFRPPQGDTGRDLDRIILQSIWS